MRASLDLIAQRNESKGFRNDVNGAAHTFRSDARAGPLSRATNSLAMAPTFVLACLCDLVDIDGPLLQTSDRPNDLRYDGGRVEPFGAEVWG